jgi:hypothetical protein
MVLFLKLLQSPFPLQLAKPKMYTMYSKTFHSVPLCYSFFSLQAGRRVPTIPYLADDGGLGLEPYTMKRPRAQLSFHSHSYAAIFKLL